MGPTPRGLLLPGMCRTLKYETIIGNEELLPYVMPAIVVFTQESRHVGLGQHHMCTGGTPHYGVGKEVVRRRTPVPSRHTPTANPS